MSVKEGEIQLILFGGQDALMDAAKQAGYHQNSEIYLEIEPVKTEQYGMGVKEPEYENGKQIPVESETIVDISIVRGRKEVTK